MQLLVSYTNLIPKLICYFWILLQQNARLPLHHQNLYIQPVYLIEAHSDIEICETPLLTLLAYTCRLHHKHIISSRKRKKIIGNWKKPVDNGPVQGWYMELMKTVLVFLDQ